MVRLAAAYAGKAALLEACEEGAAQKVRSELEELVRANEASLVPIATKAFEDSYKSHLRDGRMDRLKKTCGMPDRKRRILTADSRIQSAKSSFLFAVQARE